MQSPLYSVNWLPGMSAARTGQKAQWTHRDFVRDLYPMSDEVSLQRLDTPVFPSAKIREEEYQLPPAKTDTAAPIHHLLHPYHSHLQLQLCHPHPLLTRQNFQHNSLQKLYSPKSIENLMIHSQDCRGFLMFEDFRKSEFGGSCGSLGVGVIRRLPTARLTVRRMMRVLLLVLLLLIAPISSNDRVHARKRQNVPTTQLRAHPTAQLPRLESHLWRV
mmetsp:Transcript_19734/g.28995  ORF Transcript_19734/g.28995 Transcript_19734/m.28995 type:complete len:217 (-) Transcript_19734:219-869(-)